MRLASLKRGPPFIASPMYVGVNRALFVNQIPRTPYHLRIQPTGLL